jgi:hypothetical protein
MRIAGAMSLKRECIRPLTPLTLDDARRLIQIYVDHYNTVGRTHILDGPVFGSWVRAAVTVMLEYVCVHICSCFRQGTSLKRRRDVSRFGLRVFRTGCSPLPQI